PLIYLDNAASTQRPRQVIQSLVDMYEKHYANVHRGIHWLSEQSTDFYTEARETVRRFINAERAHEVIFTTGTTSAINLVARSWGDANVGPGDEILLTIMEHHSNIVPWQQLAQRTGCTIKFLPIHDDGLLRLDALDDMLTDRTRLLSVTAVSNVMGTINPIQELITRAHHKGALVLVDAAQSAPHQPTDVTALGADFLAFSGHKMMGPSGVGVLYGREDLLEAMPPFMGGGSMIRRVRTDGFEPADLPDKFEAGTPPIVPAIGLGAAVDYLQQVGLEKIDVYERLLTARALELLGSIEGVTVYGPPVAQRAGIVSFTIEGIHAHDVAGLLDRRGIAVRAGHHCAMPLQKRLGVVASSRASFYLYNTFEEVEQLAAGIEATVAFFRQRRRKS
ncbi:MAG: cysteine desulfurase, partial [Planctomycetales bacterium]|nr:cysteine desulfurase [Planctomycetales bacterium]